MNAKDLINKSLGNFAYFARQKTFRAKAAMIAKDLINKTLRNFAYFARQKAFRASDRQDRKGSGLDWGVSVFQIPGLMLTPRGFETVKNCFKKCPTKIEAGVKIQS